MIRVCLVGGFSWIPGLVFIYRVFEEAFGMGLRRFGIGIVGEGGALLLILACLKFESCCELH